MLVCLPFQNLCRRFVTKLRARFDCVAIRTVQSVIPLLERVLPENTAEVFARRAVREIQVILTELHRIGETADITLFSCVDCPHRV
jgi:hypothetical protein